MVPAVRSADLLGALMWTSNNEWETKIKIKMKYINLLTLVNASYYDKL